MMLSLSHVGLTVEDMDKSLWFYQKTLGLSVANDAQRSGSLYDNIYATVNSSVRIVHLSISPHQQLELFHFSNPPVLPTKTDIWDRVGIKSVVLPSASIRGPDEELYRLVCDRGGFYPEVLVQDLDASLSFCSEILELSVEKKSEDLMTTEHNGKRECFQIRYAFLSCSSGICMKVVQPLNKGLNKCYTGSERWQRAGYTHMMFSVTDIESHYAKMKKNGVRVVLPPTEIPAGPRIQHVNGKLMFFVSNEGILVELVESDLTRKIKEQMKIAE